MPSSDRRTSLARASGKCTSAAVSVAILTAHALFGYAQLSGTDSDCPGIGSTEAFCPDDLPDSGVVEVLIRASVNFEAHHVLANTLSILENRLCGSACPADAPANATCSAISCDECLAIGGVASQQRCDMALSKAVMHVSYIYMLRELWSRDQCPDCYHPDDPCCTGYHPGKPAAVILILSSFIWPHVKLLLMHVFFYWPLPAGWRRNANYWLAFFGKWTLTDVLVWCACLGVFHGLAVRGSVLELWRRVERDGVSLCSAVCTNHTRLAPECAHLCATLDAALDASVLSPADLPHSAVDAHIGFKTLIGTYLFCVAVVLSLSCSVAIDHLEDCLRSEGGGGGHPDDLGDGLRIAAAGIAINGPADGAARSAALLDRSSGGVAAAGDPKRKLFAARAPWLLHTAAVLLQVSLTWASITLPLFRRLVAGGIPDALKERGFDFDIQLNLLDLASLAIGPGGWDYLLSATFFTFVIVCPLLRGLTQLAVLLLPLSLGAAQTVHRLSRAISYYYAHEVMLVGVPLLQITVGPMTSTIFTPRVTPICGTLDEHYHESGCFILEVLPDVGYSFMCVATCVFLLTGFDGSFTHKYVHRELFPDDTEPPPRCSCCRGSKRMRV